MLETRSTRLVAAMIALILCASAGEAQEPLPAQGRNAVYFEILGNGVIYSINYDRKFTPTISGRLGIGGLGTAGAVPLMVNFMPGTGASRLELGIGPALVFAPEDIDEGEFSDELDAGLVGTATIGYRYQPVLGGFVFRVGFTPLFGQGGILPWGGVSFGYSF